jgi:DNA segregation ATPase FtsK/SpoIIIE, S-DNA-T family
VVRAHEAREGGEDEEGTLAGDWDELFKQAAEVCIQHEQGSTSLLQRRLKIGYGRAARIMDQLESAGVLGSADGSKPREVMMSLDQLDRMMGGE